MNPALQGSEAARDYFFLWQVVHVFGSLDLNAVVPLWHVPQFSPLFIAAMVILVALFFIWKTFGWQLSHFRPLSA